MAKSLEEIEKIIYALGNAAYRCGQENQNNKVPFAFSDYSYDIAMHLIASIKELFDDKEFLQRCYILETEMLRLKLKIMKRRGRVNVNK